jgi:hypothetical protein
MTMIFRHVASEIDRPVQHLLEENNQLLHQIETNILTFQVCIALIYYFTLFTVRLFIIYILLYWEMHV